MDKVGYVLRAIVLSFAGVDCRFVYVDWLTWLDLGHVLRILLIDGFATDCVCVTFAGCCGVTC